MGNRTVRLAMGVLTVAALLAGCGPGGDGGGGQPRRQTTSPSPSGGLTAQRLQAALLFRFGKWVPLANPDSGTWGSLTGRPDASGVQDAPPGVAFTPPNCKNAIWLGPDPTRLGRSPAAQVVLHEPGDTSSSGVRAWDELIALGKQPDSAVLGSGPMKGCAAVRGSFQGRTLSFQENTVPPGLGRRARGSVVSSSLPDDQRTWAVSFIANGYAGTVFLQGPVTKSQVNAFASAVYRNARQKLG